MSSCVLIVEDDAAVRELLTFHLTQAGFRTLEAASAAQAWPLADQAEHPHDVRDDVMKVLVECVHAV
jgi:DNA-binding response OmpR family regulator